MLQEPTWAYDLGDDTTTSSSSSSTRIGADVMPRIAALLLTGLLSATISRTRATSGGRRLRGRLCVCPIFDSPLTIMMALITPLYSPETAISPHKTLEPTTTTTFNLLSDRVPTKPSPSLNQHRLHTTHNPEFALLPNRLRYHEFCTDSWHIVKTHNPTERKNPTEGEKVALLKPITQITLASLAVRVGRLCRHGDSKVCTGLGLVTGRGLNRAAINLETYVLMNRSVAEMGFVE
jgi:hypothetical protein